MRVLLFSLLLVPALAAAQPRKTRVDVGVLAGVPQRDLADSNGIDAKVSPGVNIQVGHDVASHVDVFVGFRYFKVRSEEVETFQSELSNYDLDLGVRYSFALSSVATAFVEGMLMYSIADFDGGDLHDSKGLGIGGRGGVAFPIGQHVSVGAAVGYSGAIISGRSYAWLGLEGFASVAF
jgi:Outer membrane protein beta-barrel domain